MYESSDQGTERGERQSNVIAHTTFTASAPVFATRRMSNTGWKKQRMRVLVRDNFLCQAAGCAANRLSLLTIHHIVQRAAGGSDNLDNLITVCRHCHEQLHHGATLHLKNGERCSCAH
jgi:5-methylcytosine-specific restriction endonuclease McrA